MAIDLIREFDPAVVVGFGGYPSLPSLLAARATKRPSVIHEQNAVLGRTNRLMASCVDGIAVAYRNIHRFPEKLAMKRRSEEHTSELQSLMRISYAVFCLKKKTTIIHAINRTTNKHK